MGATSEMVIDERGLDQLIAGLRSRGYRTLGPVVRDSAVVHGEVSCSDDLPRGWHDRQEPGLYRLDHGDDPELFGWAVGPASWKSTFFPPEEVAWRASVEDGHVTLTVPESGDGPVALIGVRPCELVALGTLDRVLAGGAIVDDRYAARRTDAFVVVVECGAPSGTCFCASMGTGPDAGPGYDLSLTELDEGGHRFLVQVGSPAGADLLDAVDGVPAAESDRTGRQGILAAAASRMGRSLDTEGLAGLLEASIDHPRWDEVAERCLSCGNCTLVCPTCFCSDVRDVTDLTGTAERRRSWSSCFDIEHSYLHGGSVHATTASRYRQWLTHKLSTWWDQFGESGCVGCGRCIAWCPVGIDLAEEAAAIRATSRAVAGEVR